ncbi:MAG: methylated-DNA--[protein]-cysteine S-methyltransferase [Dokdonella sp.]|nr:methylated-DNA--[protein]-cysteine S-methyltransferase [Dokdonella sp.]
MNTLADPLATPVRDYERIARAIAYLRRHTARQPALAEVADHVHLSEHHFQRLFTQWAGVSPKRFLQYLTVEDAKARLAASRNVLDLAGDVGLSGPGRLHDLFVTLEAMSPGEARAGGAGLEIRYGVHDTPFGPCVIAATPRGVCGLHFAEGDGSGEARLRKDWPEARLIEDRETTALIARRIFDPLAAHAGAPLALLVKGTNFQVQVWRALLRIPPGALSTYGAIAQHLGRPSAARAVGNAVGANPIGYLIPCHRVIRKTGAFSDYHWGRPRKLAMIGWEAASGERAPIAAAGD